MYFRQPLRTLRVEGCRGERNGKATIVRQAFAGLQRYAVHFLGAQAFYRIAINRGNSGGHAVSIPLQCAPPESGSGTGCGVTLTPLLFLGEEVRIDRDRRRDVSADKERPQCV